MGDLGFCRSLNPSAKEFRPSSDHPYNNQIDDPLPHYIHFTYPYSNLPPPPLLPLPLPPPSTPALMVATSHPSLPPPSPVPTRALMLSSVASDVSESTVRRNLEVFGDVRSVQMERLRRDGVVTVHFYDLRQAAEALKAVQDQHMQQQFRLRRHFDGLLFLPPADCAPPPLPAAEAGGLIAGRAVWAQFAFPVAAGIPDGYNQGTVVVFDLDSDVSTGKLKEIFEAFGCVKEIRDIPSKNNQKLIEFYDTRDAAKAATAVNGREINGKPVAVEFHRGGGGGGYKCNFKQTRVHHINSGVVPVLHVDFNRKFVPPVVVPYRPQPPLSPPPECGEDRVAGYGGIGDDNVGIRKNGRGFFRQHRQPSVERWGGSDGGGGCDGGRSKSFKGSRYAREKTDPRFLIKDDGVISSFQDSRTTVMIKNIPNKYSQKLLLNMLDNHCIHCNDAGDDQPPSSYDFVYLPIDFVNKCNVGYGFVNMTSPAAARRLYAAFHHRNWEVFNSKKICEVSYARLQGLEALKEHFKNSKFPREAEEYMPVVFTPPRDGRRNLTEPMPIVGRSTTTTTTVTSPPPPSPSSTSLSEEVGHDEDLTDEDGDDVTAATTIRSGGVGCD